MKKVVYTGCTEEQVNWGYCDDPRGILVEGQEYECESVEAHSWHTKVKLKGVVGKFNSVCFEEA